MAQTKRVGDVVTVIFDNDELRELLGFAALEEAKAELTRWEYDEDSTVTVSADQCEVTVALLLSVDRLAESQALRASEAAARMAA